MNSNFRVSTPPRLRFPSACIHIVEEASRLVDTFLSSLFDPFERPEPPPLSGDTPRDQVRAYFESLDEKIRISFLRASILQECTERANKAYEQLVATRDKQYSQLQKKDCLGSRWAELPLEIVLNICAFDLENGPSNDPRDLKVFFARWGDLYCEGRKAVIQTSETPHEQNTIAKASKLVLSPTRVGPGSVAGLCAVTDKWTGLVAPMLYNWERSHENDSVGPEWLYQVLHEAEPILPQLEELYIPFGTAFQGYRVTGHWDEEHICVACSNSTTTRGIAIPECRVAEIPLGFLPYVGASLTNLVCLLITITQSVFDYDLGPGFGSHFHHISLRRLQTLRIAVKTGTDNGIYNDNEPLDPPQLELPALTCLMVISPRLLGHSMTALLETLNCPKLECAILSDFFFQQIDSKCANDLSIEIVDEFEDLMEALNTQFGQLKRLSFYIDQLPQQWTYSGSDPKLPKVVHGLLSALYKSLSALPTKLPMLEYLSVPTDTYNTNHDELVGFLRTRVLQGHRLRTLEISPRNAYREAKRQLHHLEFYVESVMVTDMGLEQLSINHYFP